MIFAILKVAYISLISQDYLLPFELTKYF